MFVLEWRPPATRSTSAYDMWAHAVSSITYPQVSLRHRTPMSARTSPASTEPFFGLDSTLRVYILATCDPLKSIKIMRLETESRSNSSSREREREISSADVLKVRSVHVIIHTRHVV